MTLLNQVMQEENLVKDNVEYKKMLDIMAKAHSQMCLSLEELNNANDFRQHNILFPTTKEAIISLRDEIWKTIDVVFKVVEIAFLIKDVNENIILKNGEILKYNDIKLECQNVFVDLINNLENRKIIPSIIPEEATPFFWSSSIGRYEANRRANEINMRAGHIFATRDTIALKFINRIFKGWLTEELSKLYKNKYGGSLDVLFDLVNVRIGNTSFYHLGKFYVYAISRVYTSRVKESSKTYLFLQDSLTQNNFFWRLEYPILKNLKAKIHVYRAIKKLHFVEIKFPENFHRQFNMQSVVLTTSMNKDSKCYFILEKRSESAGYICKIYQRDVLVSQFYLTKYETLELFKPYWKIYWDSVEDINFVPYIRYRWDFREEPKSYAVTDNIKLYTAYKNPLDTVWMCSYLETHLKFSSRPLFSLKQFAEAYTAYIPLCIDKDINKSLQYMDSYMQTLNMRLRDAWSLKHRSYDTNDLNNVWKNIILDAVESIKDLAKKLDIENISVLRLASIHNIYISH